MKKNIVAILMLICIKGMAQVPEDALKFSWYPQTGTARNQAIGGAMGSLGGDITATFVNPAGLGFYKTREFVFTPSFYFNNNKATFRESTLKDTRNTLSMGPIGVVIGFPENYKKQNSAFSIALTQTANLNNRVHYKAYNNLSSLSEQFAEEFAESGLLIDEALNVNSPLPYTAAPALYTFLIDTATVGNTLVIRGAPENILDAGQALQQEYLRSTKGGMYELALGGAVNDNKQWLFGGTVGIPIVDYTSNTTITESDTSSNNMNGFSSFTYQDNYTTKGVGINLKAGAIYRPKEYIRIGLALHTPSFMWLTDERTTSLNTQLETPSGAPESFGTDSKTFTNGQPGKNSYIQMSAWRAILSASYVFRETQDTRKQRAFITADVEYVNHKGGRFTNNNEAASDRDDSYTKALNKTVKDIYKGTFDFKVGGELKFNTIMGRLGFAYYGDPYKDEPYKASRMLLSGGLGYRNKGFFIDLTYVHNLTTDANFPYRLNGQANTYAVLKQTQSNVLATVGWKF